MSAEHHEPLAPKRETGYGSEPAEAFGPHTDDPFSYSRYFNKIANPGPAGIFAFGMSCFLLALYNVHTRGVHSPNAIVGMAIFVGGLVQFMAGMWEFPRGNVFGSTLFSMYGAFWMSYAIILLPGTIIVDAYPTVQEFDDALGLYFIVWFMVTVMFTLSVIRRNIAFCGLLGSWALTFLFLAVGEFTCATSNTLKQSLFRTSGAFGFITAAIAFYIGLSELLNAEMVNLFNRRLPLGNYGKSRV